MIDRDNVLEILRTSRLFHLARLEDLATEFLAQNIEQVILKYFLNGQFESILRTGQDISGYKHICITINTPAHTSIKDIFYNIQPKSHILFRCGKTRIFEALLNPTLVRF